MCETLASRDHFDKEAGLSIGRLVCRYEGWFVDKKAGLSIGRLVCRYEGWFVDRKAGLSL